MLPVEKDLQQLLKVPVKKLSLMEHCMAVMEQHLAVMEQYLAGKDSER